MMKKIVVSVLVVLTLVGCSVKENIVKKPEKEQESSNGPDGNYKATDVKAFQVEDDIIKLDYTFDSTKGITFASFAFQDGIAVPFSHTKDGEYRLSNRLVLPEENNSLSIYIKANSFKKGDEVKFGVGFLNNPDYLPEIEEYTRYNPLKQSISITAKAFVAENDFISNISEPKILKDVKWEKVSGDTSSISQPDFTENDDISVLKGFSEGKSVNEAKLIKTKNDEKLKTNIMLKGNKIPSGNLTFFIDHKPVKLSGGYDSADIEFSDSENFGIASFEIEIPKDLTKGNHTFYAILGEHKVSDGTKFYNFFQTSTRMLVIE